MNTTYSMRLTGGKQTGQETSFIGGKPKLPSGTVIPLCSLCAAEQTFFFQTAFPEDHVWNGLTLAVFACTSCADENLLIPEMLSGPLFGAKIPTNFLTSYQKNFHFEAFDSTTGKLAEGYRERIRFHQILLERGDDGPILGKMGGVPSWILEDESPRTYDSRIPMHFLLQLTPGFEFKTVRGAPPQIEVGLMGNPEPSPYDFYKLFIGNAVYMFGTTKGANNLIYALTQVS